ncbi:MAG: hypothetical protein CMJ18_04595 [Phycisphaeraceae bacterium]|nr:hypothetical protein [Phycisphaeraceae bacterium]
MDDAAAQDGRGTKLADRCLAVAVAVMVLALVAGIVMVTSAAIDDGGAPGGERSGGSIRPVTPARADVGLLLQKSAGHVLIRPAGGVTGRIDRGLAERRLKELTLVGVVRHGGEQIAYVKVAGGQTARLRVDDEIAGFYVVAIERDGVRLSLNGVEVPLGH